MRMRTTLLTLAISLTASSLISLPAIFPTAQAETSGWSLGKYVNTYAHETDFLKSSVVAPEIRRLLGKKFKILVRNLDTQSPLTRSGTVLYMSGNSAHEGGMDGAYILIEPRTKSLEVGLWEEKKFKVYRSGSTIEKPDDLKRLFEVYQTPLQ
jgi:hypothetical protein